MLGSDGTHDKGKQWVMRDYDWGCQSRQLGPGDGAGREEGKAKEVYTLNEAFSQQEGWLSNSSSQAISVHCCWAENRMCNIITKTQGGPASTLCILSIIANEIKNVRNPIISFQG